MFSARGRTTYRSFTMPRTGKKKWTHNWTAYGVLVAAAGVIIALLAWLNPGSGPSGDTIYSDARTREIAETVAVEPNNAGPPTGTTKKPSPTSRRPPPAVPETNKDEVAPSRRTEGAPPVQIGNVTSITQSGGITAGQIGNVTMGANQ